MSTLLIAARLPSWLPLLRCWRLRLNAPLVGALLLLISRSTAAEWQMVEIGAPAEIGRIIDLSVSDTEVTILTSKDGEVKVATGFSPVANYTIVRVKANGEKSSESWDPTKATPTNVKNTAEARSLLLLFGINERSVVGRAEQAITGGPGLSRAFLSTTRGANWLPKPDPRTFEAPGQGMGVGVSQPMCMDEAGWIAGQWVLTFNGGSLVLPVVWIPGENGSHQVVPLLKTRAEYAKYPNLKIRSASNRWLVGTFGPEESPKPILFAPQGGVAEGIAPTFSINELPLSPTGSDARHDFGNPMAFSVGRVVGAVGSNSAPEKITPAIWSLKVTDPVIGSIESHLVTFSGMGAIPAIVGQHAMIDTQDSVILTDGTAVIPFQISGIGFSSIIKQRRGFAVAVTKKDSRLTLIRVPKEVPP